MKTSGFSLYWLCIVVLAGLLVPGAVFGKFPCHETGTDPPVCDGNGSVTLVVPTNSPIVCLGDSVTVTASVIITNSRTQTITHYDKCDDEAAYGGDAPTYGVTWTASITGSGWSTNGTGFTATFKPPVAGSGTVSFGLGYTNASPCSGTGTSSAGGSFSVVQLILGTSNIWWFNGESPSGYTMQTTASVSGAPSGATFAWSVSGSATIVGSGSSSSISLVSTGASGSQNDTVVNVTVNGTAICQTNLTVLAPQSLNLLSNYDKMVTISGGVGYVSEIHYQILDQFGHVLPSGVPWNEDIDANGSGSTALQVTAASIPDYCISNGNLFDENWPWGEEDGWLVDPNNAYDSIGRAFPANGVYLPYSASPQSPLSNVKITHSSSNGTWRIGSATIGLGIQVKTLKWQVYQDHGRHE